MRGFAHGELQVGVEMLRGLQITEFSGGFFTATNPAFESAMLDIESEDEALVEPQM